AIANAAILILDVAVIDVAHVRHGRLALGAAYFRLLIRGSAARAITGVDRFGTSESFQVPMLHQIEPQPMTQRAAVNGDVLERHFFERAVALRAIHSKSLP